MIELGLQRIHRLLAATPLPWPAIHVAGTNGKGSICAYITGMLENYNNSAYRERTGHPPIKYGRYNSPHLLYRWDSISINHNTVTDTLFHEVETAVIRRDQALGTKASEFEILTAVAFEIYTREQVDVAVVEVGMGGRLDATNVIGQPVDSSDSSERAVARAKPLVTAIAKIGLDHQGFLGNTLEEIATEKAGIIKPGVPVVYDESNETSVMSVVDDVATSNQTQAISLGDLQLPHTDDLSRLEGRPAQKDPPHQDGSQAVPEHKRNNTSVAFRTTWLALQQLGRIPKDMSTATSAEQRDLLDLVNCMLRSTGLITVAGRLQNLDISALTGRAEPVLLDGAHNAQSAAVLAQAVDEMRAKQPWDDPTVTWVLAASDTKDVHELLAPLLYPRDRIFAVEFGPVDGMPWVKAMPGDRILTAALEVTGGNVDVRGNYEKDVVGGLEAACSAAKGGPLIVAGSLYLVGDVLRAMESTKSDG